MRAAVVTRFGPPEVLRSFGLPDPSPGPGQVLVRIEVVGVNFRDTWIRAGTVPAPGGASAPLVLGNEVGGAIVEVGDGVPCEFAGRRVVTSTGGSGGCAEYAVARVQDLIEVPDGVDLAEATGRPCSFPSALAQTVPTR